MRLRPSDPPAPTLALAAAVAVEEAVGAYLVRSPSPFRRFAPPSLSRREREGPRSAQPSGKGEGELSIKWPNDLLIAGAKLAGILLERAGDAIVIGIGVNLAHHPDDLDRPATSLAAHGASVAPGDFLEALTECFARWLGRWRGEGLGPVRQRWLERAHPIGTALSARLPDCGAIDGLFDGLDPDGALILRLASGERRVIHAGDVFLI